MSILVRAALVLGLVFSTMPVAAFDLAPWQSAHFAGNPLAGSITDTQGKPADMAALQNAILAADFVLVGEIHNNPDHHRIQAGIIDLIASAGKKPAVVLEMVPAGMQTLLDTAPRDADALGDALDWEKRGWPDWTIYTPVARAAFAHGLKLIAGDLDRDTIRAIGKQGFAALTDAERQRLGVDAPLAEADREAMAEELKTSHCGMLPDKAIPAMIGVQHARDGALAAAMAANASTGAILIAGAGHVRKDLAAAAVLRRLLPDANILVIGLREVDESENIADYTDDAPYDFMILTPKADISDQCEGLAETLKRPAR